MARFFFCLVCQLLDRLKKKNTQDLDLDWATSHDSIEILHFTCTVSMLLNLSAHINQIFQNTRSRGVVRHV